MIYILKISKLRKCKQINNNIKILGSRRKPIFKKLNPDSFITVRVHSTIKLFFMKINSFISTLKTLYTKSNN